MRKFFIALAILGVASVAHAWPRGGNYAQSTFQNTGNKGSSFAVAVGTTTPVQIYSTATGDREITIQNPDANYSLYLGTHSAVSASSGPRFFIAPLSTITIDATFDIWGIYASASSGNTVLGLVEKDNRD